MLASIQNIEHAKRALVLLDRHLQNRVTAEAPDDWYLRIKYLRQLCDVAAVKVRDGPAPRTGGYARAAAAAGGCRQGMALGGGSGLDCGQENSVIGS